MSQKENTVIRDFQITAEEYDEFNKTQKINSDFDKEIKKLLEKGGER